jgi:hypothetical protein
MESQVRTLFTLRIVQDATHPFSVEAGPTALSNDMENSVYAGHLLLVRGELVPPAVGRGSG